MGPYIILICLILGAIGAWSIGGMLSKSDTSKKEPPQLSKFEQKMKASADELQAIIDEAWKNPEFQEASKN